MVIETILNKVEINKKTLAQKKSVANITIDSVSKIGTKKIIINVSTELKKRKILCILCNIRQN